MRAPTAGPGVTISPYCIRTEVEKVTPKVFSWLTLHSRPYQGEIWYTKGCKSMALNACACLLASPVDVVQRLAPEIDCAADPR